MKKKYVLFNKKYGYLNYNYDLICGYSFYYNISYAKKFDNLYSLHEFVVFNSLRLSDYKICLLEKDGIKILNNDIFNKDTIIVSSKTKKEYLECLRYKREKKMFLFYLFNFLFFFGLIFICFVSRI